ncbi:MAG: hypothetical protein R3F59_38715, partial [Myxococcota bacterium]
MVARASYFGELLQERTVRRGDTLQVGGSSSFAVPLPEGVPYLARILWISATTAAVRDGAGVVHHAEPGRDVVVEAGPLELRVSVVEQFAFRRTEPVAAAGSVAWLLVVVMAAALTAQLYWLEQRQCAIAGSLLPGLPDLGVWVAALVAPLLGAVVAGFVILGAENTRRALPALGLPVLALVAPLVYWAGGFEWRSGSEVMATTFAFCNDSGGEQGGTGG